jgi:predicted RNA-binding protein with PUA-like domain
MKKSDYLLFYHSGKNPGIVAIAEVSREYYPDPTATEGNWLVVDVVPVRPLERFISLAEVKHNPDLKDMVLANSPRLSVQPVKKEEFDIIMELEKKFELQQKLL